MRLFTALCFDEDTKSALFLAEKAAEKEGNGNFTQKDNLHLTLVFIGETEREEDIKSALDEIGFSSFEYNIEGIGTFEKGILWAGTEKSKDLSALQKAVLQKLESIGIETEKREYVPHITLARKFKPNEDFSAFNIAALLPQGKIKAERISLMKSERVEGALKYSEIYSKNLF